MKKRKMIMLIGILALLPVIFGGCTKEKTSAINDKNVFKDINVKELKADLKKDDIQIIDIREEHQYIGWEEQDGPGGHIEGAVDFPEFWLQVEKNNSKLDTELKRRNLDKTKKTIIYDNGNVSEDTYNNFSKLGFKDLYALKGGINDWEDKGLNIEKMKNYEVLVHPQWVYDLIENKNPDTFKGGDFKIIEIDFGKNKGDYKKGHIPGAIAIDDSLNHVEGERILPNYEKMSDEVKFSYWNRPNDNIIKEKLENMGIKKDTTVILYGNNTTAAARCGVVMKYAGVKDVRLLNGGKNLVKLKDMKLEQGVVQYSPIKDFGVKVPQNPNILIDYEEELKLVEDTENAVIASVRSFEEYKCEKSGYTYIKSAGEIKNSRFAYAGSDPYNMQDYRNIDDTMFNYEIIKERWEKWGITPDKKISYHCGTGWRASETYFYALAMGWNDICVYDGGWYEWHLKEDSPKKEKGLPKDAPETKPNSFF